MGERILDWIGEIISGPKRRFFWAFVIVALVIGVIVFPYIDANFSITTESRSALAICRIW